ncbi:MAG: PD-(D/E)XK nuclease family protein, partial [Acidobacteriota bacterium]|nr:PD-(D/E)XK nuclease family protein [Acidobacteriota bacterium]
MSPRFEADNLRLELSVADLVDADLRRNLGFAQRGGYERMWLGQAIHRGYQEDMQADDSTYRVEVPVTASIAHRGWQVTFRGRIDGLRTTEEGAVVEEVKSVRRGELAPAVREIYERQAMLYAWMLELNDHRVAGAELVLIEIGQRAIQRYPVDLDLPAVERLVRRRINSLLRDYELQRDAAQTRHRAGENLSFPYPEIRPGQDRIIERVSRALEQGGHLLLEAP